MRHVPMDKILKLKTPLMSISWSKKACYISFVNKDLNGPSSYNDRNRNS